MHTTTYSPLGDAPPKFLALQPGEYVSTDGRFRLARVVNRPPAWNVELTTDYYNDLVDLHPEDFTDVPDTQVVDGAASRKDAAALFAADWPQLVAVLRAREAI